jgi:DNA-binding XRE family transcriptional regulator
LGVVVDWTGEFQKWLDSLDAKADAGDHSAQRQVEYAEDRRRLLRQCSVTRRCGDRPVATREEQGIMKLEDKGGQRLRRKLTNPDHAQHVAEIRESMREMDRTYAMNLAMVRKAAQLTQEDLASRLGKGQATVSKLERQNDLLLSTLASYIQAAGAEAQLVVTVAGKELRYDLRQLGAADSVVTTT